MMANQENISTMLTIKAKLVIEVIETNYFISSERSLEALLEFIWILIEVVFG